MTPDELVTVKEEVLLMETVAVVTTRMELALEAASLEAVARADGTDEDLKVSFAQSCTYEAGEAVDSDDESF